jgi:hypothetical protein
LACAILDGGHELLSSASGIFGFLLIQILRHPSPRLQGLESPGFISPKTFFGNTFDGPTHVASITRQLQKNIENA